MLFSPPIYHPFLQSQTFAWLLLFICSHLKVTEKLIFLIVISPPIYHPFLPDKSLDRAERLDWKRDFSFPLFYSLQKKEGGRKGERMAKIVILSQSFLLDQTLYSSAFLFALISNLNVTILLCYTITHFSPFLQSQTFFFASPLYLLSSLT